MFTPWMITTRPWASVIQRPSWPSGCAGTPANAWRRHSQDARGDGRQRRAPHAGAAASATAPMSSTVALARPRTTMTSSAA